MVAREGILLAAREVIILVLVVAVLLWCMHELRRRL